MKERNVSRDFVEGKPAKWGVNNNINRILVWIKSDVWVGLSTLLFYLLLIKTPWKMTNETLLRHRCCVLYVSQQQGICVVATQQIRIRIKDDVYASTSRSEMVGSLVLNTHFLLLPCLYLVNRDVFARQRSESEAHLSVRYSDIFVRRCVLPNVHLYVGHRTRQPHCSVSLSEGKSDIN